jgi:hypothetical protein
MTQKSIYPKIDVRVVYHMDQKSVMYFETYLRKTYRRKYYLWKFYREVTIGSKIFTPEEVLDSMIRFQTEIYRCQILGKVNPKLIMQVGGVNYPLFEKDTDQTPEHVRIIQNQLKGLR